MAAKEPTSFFGSFIPYLDLIGFVPVAMSPGTVEVRLPVRAELNNSAGNIHGGVLLSGLDYVMSAAARSSDPHNFSVSTVDMTTSFLAAAKGDIAFRATCLRQGKSIAFCEGEARDANGQLVAKGSGTFSLRRKVAGGAMRGSSI